MDSPLNIGYLADYPEWAEELANQHWEEWRDLISTWSRPQAIEELREHTKHRQGIPTTIVAFDGDLLLGSVSLEICDYKEIQHYSPWLTSLWVMPFARHRGLGGYLVQRLVHEAACLKIPRLYLLTIDHTVFYEKLGWTLSEVGFFGDNEIYILGINPKYLSEEELRFH
jgi:N-acetylglutamate synthase-like GNAT family acetyltransferase